MFSKILITLVSSILWLPCQASLSLHHMTLEEKVGQLLMVHFQGEQANEDAKKLVQDTHVGGIIYYLWANGLHSPEQVRTLSAGLQGLARQNRHPIPLLIAVDQEGGLISRLTEGFTATPDNLTLAKSGDPSLAEKYAFIVGKELLAVGINMNLAPVVDINNNPRNPIIGVRSFGDNAQTVITYGSRALKGYHRAGVITSLKHFPGHGDVTTDSHETLPVINKTRAQLDALELLPFAALAHEADTVMTAHLSIPSLDPERCATTSKKILDILRDEIGFKGVIITDSLVMEGVLKQSGADLHEASLLALEAGCDILLLGGRQLTGTRVNLELSTADVQKVHSALVKAVKSGRISEERIDRSVEKVLSLKSRYIPAVQSPSNPLVE